MQDKGQDSRRGTERLFSGGDLIRAAATYTGLSVDLRIRDTEDAFYNVIRSFGSFSLEHALLFPLLVLFFAWFRKQYGRGTGKKGAVRFLAVLFALFMVFGRAFELGNSWDLAVTWYDGQLVKAAIMAAGYILLFYRLITCLFDAADRPGLPAVPEGAAERRCPAIIKRYLRALQEHPFLTVFLTTLILSVPNAILSWPARLMGDTRNQIVQAYSELQLTGSAYLEPDQILKAGVFINQNHPVVHTLLIHWCLLLGEAVGSLNAGIAVYSLVQGLTLLASYAYACSTLIRKKGAKAGGVTALAVYLLIHPLIADYLFLVSKDTLYAAFFLLFATNLFRILSKEKDGKVIAGTILSMIGMILFRNEGWGLLAIVSLAGAIILKEIRKPCLIALAAVAVFSTLLTRVLFPALGFTPATAREPFSVPFQQTARYVRDHGDEVTEAEQEAIDRVLKYKGLAKAYDPESSDPVKKLYQEGATFDDFTAYFGAWGGMMLKHPDPYLQATINNNYLYLYPGEARIYYYTLANSKKRMETTNINLAEIGKGFEVNELTPAQVTYEDIIGRIKKTPGFALLFTPAFYSWAVILGLALVIRKKNRRACVLMCVPATVLLFCLLGPLNGDYGRYQFPIILSLPPILMMALRLLKDSRAEAAGQQADKEISR